MTPGDTLGPYRIEAVLGRAGAVAVLRASATGRLVRLYVAEVRDVDGFVRRARGAAVLDHPGAGAVIAVGTSEGRGYVATEWIEGDTLARHLEKGPAALADRLRWARAIADVLVLAHRKGIAHGDVSAENIVVRDGDVVVVGFALRPGSEQEDQRGWAGLAARILGGEEPEWLRAVVMRARACELGSMRDVVSALDAGVVAPPALGGEVHASTARGVRPPSLVGERGATLRPRRLRGAALALAAISAIAALALVWHARAPAPGAARTSAIAAPNANSPPTTPAAALFAGAMQSMHDGSIEQARATLEEVLHADPEFASAHLRLALLRLLSVVIDDGTRDHFARAVRQRTTLDAHERVLLDAFEPSMRSDPVFSLSEERMQAALARVPSDADFAFHLGVAHLLAGNLPRLIVEMDRTLIDDPAFASASLAKAYAWLQLDDAATAKKEYERCLVISPSATTCLHDLADLLAREGDCAGVEHLSRRTIALEPRSSAGYYMLGLSLAAQHRADAARTAFEELVERVAPDAHDVEAASIATYRSLLGGDFAEAERALDAWDVAIERSTEQWVHYPPVEVRMELYLETGRPEKAIPIGKAFLARHSAWMQTSLADDASLLVLGALHRARWISQATLDKERTRWRRTSVDGGTSFGEKLRGQQAWLWAYISAVASPAEARDALDARASYPSLAPIAIRHPVEVDGMIGRVMVLAGRGDQALPLLERSAHSCMAHESPIFHTQSLAALADALRSRGQRDEACDHYLEIARRWGAARPPSLTALAAARAAESLDCHVSAVVP